MSYDLDPNYGLPLWQSLVRYFRAFPPLVQAPQKPAPRRGMGRSPKLSRVADTGRAANAGRYEERSPGPVRIAGLR